MSAIKLTETRVEGIKAPDPSGRQQLYWDATTPGFGVVASGKSKSKSYVAQCGVNGKTRRVTIGSTAIYSLEQGRERAQAALRDMRAGIDPKARAKAEAASGITFGAALEAYLAYAAKRKGKKKPLRPKSREDYRRFAQYLGAWNDTPLRDITRKMVEARHEAIPEEVAKRKNSELATGYAAANMAMTVLRIVWNYVDVSTDGGLPSNPTKVLHDKWYEVEPREGCVEATELPAFYAAVMGLKNPVQRDLLRLVLFSGLRLGEAAALSWEEVDLQARVIHIPRTRTKNRKKLDLPLSDFLHDLLVARRGLALREWVFPANSRSGHLVDVKFACGQVAKTFGRKISAHDLRRTFITVAARCDITTYLLKALVNHKDKDIHADYIIFTAEDLRPAMQQVTDRLRAYIGLEGPQGNVAKIG